ncbi:MAG: hypothetical protein IKF97_03465 [Clostridia bacterium]|nr:hypothetical protein [Clostridia bacterium]
MVFLFILLSIIIFTILIINSNIKIEIRHINYFSQKGKKSNNTKLQSSTNHIDIRIKLIILGFIPLFWQTINNQKIEEAKKNNKIKNKLKKIYEKLKRKNENTKKVGILEILKIVKEKINIIIKEFYLDLSFATDDTVFTSMLVPIISTFLSILLYKKQVKQNKLNYQITPLYNSRKFNKC